MIVLPNPGLPPETPRALPEPDAGGVTLVRFGDVLAAVQLRRDPDAAADATPHVADVFNGRGFFGEASTVSALATANPTVADAPHCEATIVPNGAAAPRPVPGPAGPTESVSSIASAAPVGTTQPTTSIVAGGAVPSASIGDRARSAVVLSVPVVAMPASAPVGTAPGLLRRAPFTAAASAPARAAPPRTPARAGTDVAAAAAPQVVVRAGEGGVEVIARVERLGAEARSTLRARIAALLSRHGFSGGVVRLIGGTPAPRG